MILSSEIDVFSIVCILKKFKNRAGRLLHFQEVKR